MKVIVVEHNWNEPADDTIRAHLMADSAIMTTGKPFFLPDVVPHLQARLTLAVRVGKLGKHVARKFAPRYCQDCTAAIVAVPAGGDGAQPLAAALDGALMVGNWIPFDTPTLPSAATLAMTCNDATTCTATTATLNHPIDEVIECVSKYCTLKTGDIILTGLHPHATPLRINDRLSASLNGQTVLEVRIK